MPITTAGRDYLANRHGTQTPAVVTNFVYALIPDLDTSQTPPVTETMPAAEHIVHSPAVSKDGYVNPNQVVYSSILLPDVGGFDYNWIGLETDDGTLLAVNYIPTRTKIIQSGEQNGDFQNQNVAIEYVGVQDLTGITVSAESWQVDHLGQLKSHDNSQMNAMKKVYGRQAWLNDSFQLYYSGGNFYIRSGECVVGGHHLSMGSVMQVIGATNGVTVWLDVYSEYSAIDKSEQFKFIINDGTNVSDYVEQGIEHTVVKLGTIDGSNVVTDERLHILDLLSMTDNIKGLVQRLDNIDTLLASDETTLDTLQELVDFVELNRSDFDSLGISGVAGLQTALNGKSNTGHGHIASDLPSASTTAEGVVRLTNSTGSSSEILAPTAAALKAVKEIANSKIDGTGKLQRWAGSASTVNLTLSEGLYIVRTASGVCLLPAFGDSSGTVTRCTGVVLISGDGAGARGIVYVKYDQGVLTCVNQSYESPFSTTPLNIFNVYSLL